jgi:ATP-dependent 26S proteasome regulatory subunit
MDLRSLFKAAELDFHSAEDRTQFAELMRQAESCPEQVVSELMAVRQSRDKAVEAAEEIENLIKDLVEQNATLCHLESLGRPQPDGGLRAVCRIGPQLQELGVHPTVDYDDLARLQPWEWVLVNDGVVIGTWQNDAALLGTQLGEIVTFEGFADREQAQVRVTRPGHDETIVTLAGEVRLADIQVGARLILQRDDPRWAIGMLPATNVESRFEVPIDSLHARLDELAGIDEIAEPFLQDILLRTVYGDVRDEFDLTPMNGALLYSYKPGMGKSVFCEALAVTLRDFGKESGFDVALFHIKPNQLKSMWHGEDGRIVRDLFASIRAREQQERTRSLIVLVVFDEIDSLQKRAGSNQSVGSGAHSDALEALLVEMQGIGSKTKTAGAPVHRLCIGLTNRPDRLDDALKRPGRFGDFVRAMPAITQESATEIMAVYARRASLPWSIDNQIRQSVPVEEIIARFLRPAVARVFPAVVAQFATDSQRTTDVTAGQILAGVHYQDAVNRAKKRAALRRLMGDGIPAICFEDIVDSLLAVAVDTAQQMEADPGMLVQQLQIKVPVVRVTAVPVTELEQHQFLKVHSA